VLFISPTIIGNGFRVNFLNAPRAFGGGRVFVLISGAGFGLMQNNFPAGSSSNNVVLNNVCMGPLVSDFQQLVLCCLRTVHRNSVFCGFVVLFVFRANTSANDSSYDPNEKSIKVAHQSNGLTQKALQWPYEKSKAMAPRRQQSHRRSLMRSASSISSLIRKSAQLFVLARYIAKK
jgi:hypothetical protein